MSTFNTTYDDPAHRRRARSTHDRARALLGQVMGYVAVTVGFAALGAYLGRDLERRDRAGAASSPRSPLVIGLNIAAARAASNSRSGCCSGSVSLLGLAVAPLIADYANADPSALWQAAGATAAFVAALGAYGYATRRDLSLVGPPAVLGAARPDRVRDRRDLRLDPGRQPHLRRRRPRDLRRASRSSTSTACAAAPPTPPCRSRPGSSSTSSTSSCWSWTCSAAGATEPTPTQPQGVTMSTTQLHHHRRARGVRPRGRPDEVRGHDDAGRRRRPRQGLLPAPRLASGHRLQARARARAACRSPRPARRPRSSSGRARRR